MIKKLVSMLLYAFFVACFLTLSGCSGDDAGSALANENLVSHQALLVRGGADSSGSSITGTVFVLGEPGSNAGSRIQITATLQIDKGDWAGVMLEIPKEWRISEVLSDYPQDGNSPESYVTVLQTGADEAFNKRIAIGFTKDRPELSRGGQGDISISLEPAVPMKQLPKEIEIVCGLGSQGDTIAYASHETISVPLTSQ
jgi:hypothetical protein